MKNIFLIPIILIIVFTGCRVMKITQDAFIYCYDGNNTGLDTMINIEGYYTMNKIFSKPNKTKSYNIYNFVFYDDGLFIYRFDSLYNFNLYGRYIVSNDTIRAQFLDQAPVNPEINEVWFKIIDKNRILWLYEKPWTKMTTKDIEDFRKKDYYRVDTAKYVPFEKLPNTDKFWIKRQKFFWCDEKRYKEFKAKIKKEKIKKYNDFKHR
ncbi:MAG: hypothetical protein K8R54_02970 [Bacteroidales bacterium]|nr:hypothetical protein [Bacteroidales bacterium]